MNRVLIIGIDAADLTLIKPWAEAGHLPNIARILNNGTFAPMRSTLPIMSPPAWTSMISGLNPGKHGIYDFISRQPGSYRLQSNRSDLTNFRTIFHHASDHNQHVIAMNIPLTYPPSQVRGMMISGLAAPETGKYAYPPELRDELVRQGYRVNVHEFEPGHEREWVADLYAVARKQTETMIRFLHQEPWNLAMIVYRAVDETEAFFWHHMDETHPQHDPVAAKEYGSVIFDAHRMVDEEVGKLVEAAGPETTVALVSDHGGGAFHREVFLNVWLERQGFLRRKPPRALNELRKMVMRKLHLDRDTLARLLDWPLAWAIRNRIPMKIQHALVPEAAVTLAEVADWSRTRAYSFGNIGQIYVNLRGREPHGIVQPGRDYERLLDEITDALFQLKDNGKPVVDAVYRRKDIYHGPYAEHGPDLNIIMRNLAYASQSWREMGSTGEVFGDANAVTHCTGIHRPLGMMALCGPTIPARGQQDEVQIIDIAPTVLWLLGIPIPDNIDGRVLRECLDTGQLEEQPPVFSATDPAEEHGEIKAATWDSPEEEQEVLERLRNLGYLE